LRLAFGILFSVIIIAMAVCARIAKNSGKRMGFAAACLLAALILPMAGNGIIIVSGNKTVSLIGIWVPGNKAVPSEKLASGTDGNT